MKNHNKTINSDKINPYGNNSFDQINKKDLVETIEAFSKNLESENISNDLMKEFFKLAELNIDKQLPIASKTTLID